MILTLPLPLHLLEIFAFFLLVSHFGFLRVLGFYLLPALLGFVVLSLQSRAALMQIQRVLAQGKDPGRALLSTAANFVAGIFLLIPSISSRIAAALLLIPGLRQVVLIAVHAWIVRKIAAGVTRASRRFSGAGFRADFRTGGFQNRSWEEESRVERDAEVIDVEPLEIEHSDPSKTRRDS